MSVVLLGLLLLNGCGGGGGGGGASACASGDSPYIGCWITQGCPSIDNPVNSIPVWGTIRYEFANNGNINRLVKVYTDSSCSGSPVYVDDAFTSLAFVELAAEMDPSGLAGHRLKVIDVDVGEAEASEVLAVVTGGTLCLSDNLQLTADGYSFYFSTTASAVDLVSNCLDAY